MLRLKFLSHLCQLTLKCPSDESFVNCQQIKIYAILDNKISLSLLSVRVKVNKNF